MIKILILLLIINGGKYNKKELMKLTKDERANIAIDNIIQNMSKTIEDKKNDPDNQNKINNLRQYFFDDNNKEFHLEIIKRTFKRR